MNAEPNTSLIGGLGPGGLPDLVFDFPLPPGEFVLAENQNSARIREPYSLSRYPVTVAQFGAFVAARGYEQDQFWSTKGRTWRDGKAALQGVPDWLRGEYQKQGSPILRPADYDGVFQTPNHPRVGISWYEAEAFCRWISEKLNVRIRLPTEAEWEQAARWNNRRERADNRSYPWGKTDEKDLARRCDYRRTGIGHTSAVGQFPAGQAESGALDLCGNVWEWCLDRYVLKQRYRVLRGGSWHEELCSELSCSCREPCHPEHRGDQIGFRCVRLDGV